MLGYIRGMWKIERKRREREVQEDEEDDVEELEEEKEIGAQGGRI